MARPKGSKNKEDKEPVEEVKEVTPVSDEAPDLIARRKLRESK